MAPKRDGNLLTWCGALALKKLEVALGECSQLRCSGKEEASEWNEVQGRFPLLYALWNRAISQIGQARTNQKINPFEPKFLSDRHPRWLASIPSRNLASCSLMLLRCGTIGYETIRQMLHQSLMPVPKTIEAQYKEATR